MAGNDFLASLVLPLLNMVTIVFTCWTAIGWKEICHSNISFDNQRRFKLSSIIIIIIIREWNGYNFTCSIKWGQILFYWDLHNSYSIQMHFIRQCLTAKYGIIAFAPLWFFPSLSEFIFQRRAKWVYHFPSFSLESVWISSMTMPVFCHEALKRNYIIGNAGPIELNI